MVNPVTGEEWKEDESRLAQCSPGLDDVVYVLKKTRGRFGKANVAQPGDWGIVISAWTNQMGTRKVSILRYDGTEACTTSSSIRFWQTTPGERRAWDEVKLGWMSRTYIPVIVNKQPKISRSRKTVGRRRWINSRDGAAYLVRTLNSDEKVWLNKSKCHPHDWNDLDDEAKGCVSVRLPIWLATKIGALGRV